MPDRKTQKLLEGLQGDLERELRSSLQYMYQSSLVFGLRGLQLSPYLRRQAEEEMKHVAFISDQIVSLGATPKFTLPKISETKDLKQMLENDLDAERHAILEYRERAKQAEMAGEIGLKLRLETMIADETEHMRGLEKILRGWELAPA